MGLDKYLVSVSVSQLPSFLCGGIEIDLNSEWGSNWLNFRRWAEINLIFVWEIELDLVLVLGSKVTCFFGGRSKLTVCGPKLTYFRSDDRLIWFLCRWWWSKLTWFLYVGRKSLGFSVSIEVDLVWNWLGFSVGIEIDFVFGRGSKSTSVCVWAKNYLVWIYGSKVTWCLGMDRNCLGFCVRSEKDL